MKQAGFQFLWDFYLSGFYSVENYLRGLTARKVYTAIPTKLPQLPLAIRNE